MPTYNWKDDRILLLIDIFGKPQSSFREVSSLQDAKTWQPQSQEERDAWEQLTSTENRELLKAWYARGSYLNPTADLFRHALEQTIGEMLPLKPPS
jgi:hypothetical protein